mmetsp:Transcript_12779/g.44818  ORF Transcript_12779/g.44818 Transcript_12779/m.44818 type:complete len:202 (-) Transcript_12779:5-610(-)
MSKQAAKNSDGWICGTFPPGPIQTSAFKNTGNPMLSLLPASSLRNVKQGTMHLGSLKSNLTPTRALWGQTRLCSTTRRQNSWKVKSDVLLGGCAMTAMSFKDPQLPQLTSASRNMTLLPLLRALSSLAELFVAWLQMMSSGLEIPKKCSVFDRFSPHCIALLPYSPDFSHSHSLPCILSSSTTSSRTGCEVPCCLRCLCFP